MEFNPTKSSVSERTKTTNYEGGLAWAPDTPEMALYKRAINNLLEDSYYETGEESLEELVERIRDCLSGDPEVQTFALQLAVYARNEMGLRTVPQVILTVAAREGDTDEIRQAIREYGPRIIRRADEPATILGIQSELYDVDGSVPRPLRDAIEESLRSFDSYQLMKYRQSGREKNLRDVFNIVHPKPASKTQGKMWDRFMTGHLDTNEMEPLDPPQTWEVILTEKGNTKDAWMEILPRLGLMGKIRNLRNMMEVGVPSDEILTTDDLQIVRRHRMFPFRFYQAYKALQDAGLCDNHTAAFLEKAMDETVAHLPGDWTNSLVAVDVSSSMDNYTISSNSDMTCKEIACLFGAAIGLEGAEVQVFSDEARHVTFHPGTPVLELTEKIANKMRSGSTNGYKVLDGTPLDHPGFDRIVYLTDMQLWDSTGFGTGRTLRDAFEEYRESINSETSLYMVDLSSYGTLQTPESVPRVYDISGWSEKILQFIPHVEKPGEIFDRIKSI